jgi:hypothetical protein
MYIRYFHKIDNELSSSPVKTIIIYWIQILDMFLVKPVALSAASTGVAVAIAVAGALSLHILPQFIQRLQHFLSIIQAGSEIIACKYCIWNSTLQQVHDFTFDSRLSKKRSKYLPAKTHVASDAFAPTR